MTIYSLEFDKTRQVERQRPGFDFRWRHFLFFLLDQGATAPPRCSSVGVRRLPSLSLFFLRRFFLSKRRDFLGVFERRRRRRRKLFDVASQKYRVCARTRRGSNTRVHSWGEIVSKKKKKSLAVGVSFSELLLRVFFVVSSERFLKGTFTLLKRCSRGLLGEIRGKNARYLDTLRYLRRTQRVRWRTCFALNRLRGVDRD